MKPYFNGTKTILVFIKHIELLQQYLITVAVSHCCSSISLLQQHLITVAASHYCSSISLLQQHLITVASHYCSSISLLQQYLITVAASQYCSNISLLQQYNITAAVSHSLKHNIKQTSLQERQSPTNENELHYSRKVGEANLLVMWSLPDSSVLVMRYINSGIRMGDHERSECAVQKFSKFDTILKV